MPQPTYLNRVKEADISAGENELQQIVDIQNNDGYCLSSIVVAPTKIFLHFTQVPYIDIPPIPPQNP